jgi:PBP1b-binding outer membrane lipoprotein LpoB
MKNLMRIFVMVLTVIKRVIAVLDFPKDIDDFITYANGIHDSMVASPYFAALAAKLTTLRNDITALVAKQTAVNTMPPTATVTQRDDALQKVQGDLRGLRMDVQSLADATPASAEDIITSAGMKVKKQGAVNKQDFVVKDGEVSGSVLLVAKGIQGERNASEWAKSVDGTNWQYITTTLAANTTESGFVKGSIWDFRHRSILKDGPTDWIEVHGHVIK